MPRARPVQGATAVAAMFFFDVSLLVLMFGAIVLGIVLGALRPGLLHHTAEAAAGDDEESYYIHRSSIGPEPTPLLKCLAVSFLSIRTSE
jgi:chromate transporter